MPETMLTISILFMITGVLLPLMVGMRIQLADKKRSMHAAEAAYHSVVEHKISGHTSGSREIDGVLYSWTIGERKICVEYFSYNSAAERICVEDSI